MRMRNSMHTVAAYILHEKIILRRANVKKIDISGNQCIVGTFYFILKVFSYKFVSCHDLSTGKERLMK